MRSKTKEYSRSEFFVILAYCIYISCEILNYTQFKNLPGWSFVYKMIITVVAWIAIVGIIIQTKQNIKWLILSICIVAIGLVIVFYNDQLINTAMLLIFIVAGSSIHDENLFKYHWIIVGSLVAFTLLLYVVGIYTPDYIVRNTVTEYTKRAYLGFSYTTYPPNYLIHLMITYYASRKNQIQLKDTIIFLAINCLFFALTRTYAVFYEIFLFIGLLWLLRVKNGLYATKLFGVISTLFMPIMAILAIWLSVIYTPTNPILLMLNQVLSSRLSLAHTGILRYGLRLFGNPVEWTGGRYGIERFDAYFYVDSSYVNIALTYGIIALIFVVICFSILNYKAFKRGNYKLCIGFIILALHSFSDPQLLELKYNPFLVIIFAAFIPNMESVLSIGYE